MEVHSHLIRSPPPVYWPSKVFEFSAAGWNSPISPSNRSDRAFSPESGSDERSYHSYGARSQSEERIISPSGDLLSPGTLSPVRGQTPAYSPMRGYTPDIQDFSPPPDRSRKYSTPEGVRMFTTRSMSQSYHRSTSTNSTTSPCTSQANHRIRSRTPDEEFSPSRFNIYTLHHRSQILRNKSESSYLVTSPGRDMVTHYQPVSRRSLANLGSRATRKSSDFLSWLPNRSRSRSRPDAKSMENLQSPTSNNRSLNANYRLSHKSLNFVSADEAGLLISDTGPPVGGGASPRPTRRRFSGLKKSFSLKQKKSTGGPLYVDIDTQNL
ncbi:uncharacterized protein LOC111702441 isoform X2 [Eurytemora carolleeae]|uniref:uncharacterized protein LOC111702441 isoform X2 n=1 Tax=Eurytemora carolleeae TaxID=1294199 RepID=UPI000C774DC9|nr:uncharacterized protein LOC111702441 isoform X2 [Eurytemora carolleeae]|eukprot:XP_023329892.1 uncharacterized protein LOC111702441 isoform X2 [Eurytemora affinis]